MEPEMCSVGVYLPVYAIILISILVAVLILLLVGFMLRMFKNREKVLEMSYPNKIIHFKSIGIQCNELSLPFEVPKITHPKLKKAISENTIKLELRESFFKDNTCLKNNEIMTKHYSEDVLDSISIKDNKINTVKKDNNNLHLNSMKTTILAINASKIGPDQMRNIREAIMKKKRLQSSNDDKEELIDNNSQSISEKIPEENVVSTQINIYDVPQPSPRTSQTVIYETVQEKNDQQRVVKDCETQYSLPFANDDKDNKYCNANIAQCKRTSAIDIVNLKQDNPDKNFEIMLF